MTNSETTILDLIIHHNGTVRGVEDDGEWTYVHLNFPTFMDRTLFSYALRTAWKHVNRMPGAPGQEPCYAIAYKTGAHTL